MARAAAVLLSFVLASLVLTPQAQSADTRRSPGPPGVSTAAWMPITRDLGFVVEQAASDLNSAAMPAAAGYFAVRRHDGWVRLDPVPQAARLRWPLRSRGESHWLPIDNRFGFVAETPVSARGAAAAPAVFGYFMAKRVGSGLRLDPLAHGALFDAPLTASRPGMPLPITAGLRFVIERSSDPPGGAPMASALGYFEVKSAGQWLRLNPIGAGRLLRQPL